MNYQNLPDTLKGQKWFCLWKIETRDGKKTKIPYQINGARARPNDPSTFSSYKEVMSVFLKGGYDGIGLLNKKLVGVDADECILPDGKLNELGTDVVNILDSYSERSPSGKGIRIWVIADSIQYDKAKYYINNRKLHLEVYVPGQTQHFLTLTGNAIRNMEVMERSAELQMLLDKYMVRPDAESIRTPLDVPGSVLTDEQVIEVASKAANAEKFLSLYEGSDLNEVGADHSGLDLSLCKILAFYCGGDAEQMDRLFRGSALMRDKWDSRRGNGTYGDMTINKAIRSCGDFYKPIARLPAQDDFDEILMMLEEMQPEQNPRYRDSDLGYGRLFADVYKGILSYVPERKKWFWYDGKRWIPDEGSLRAMELCKDLADSLLRYALQISNEDIRTNFLKSTVQKWQKRAFRETYLKEAQSIYPVYMKDFDTNKYLFNCSNGTLDLSTMDFKEHNPDDRITKLTQVVYDPSADSIRFKEFIDEIMSGDSEKAAYLQKALGYAISGDTRFECMFFLYGETTRNGKGTLMESILRVMGDYGKAVRPETIALKRNANSDGPSEDIARLAGIRLANISEPSRGLLLNVAMVKSMTGNDTLNARFLHENSFDFEPQFKMYVNTNYLPVVNDMTLFSSNRVLIIPFDKHFEEWEQDKSLKSEFAKPETQSAILNWLIEGYGKLYKEGFTPPASVVEATKAYFHDSNKVLQFVEECLIEDPAAEVKALQVYDEYRSWCSDNGCYVENSKNFYQELRKFAEVVRRRPKKGGEKTSLLIGYRIKDFAEPLL